MPQRCVLYYHLTWLTSPPIWWDSIGRWFCHQMMHKVNHKILLASMDVCRRCSYHAEVGMSYNIFSFLEIKVLWDFMVVGGFRI
jgi:hypothetical protein